MVSPELETEDNGTGVIGKILNKSGSYMEKRYLASMACYSNAGL